MTLVIYAALVVACACAIVIAIVSLWMVLRPDPSLRPKRYWILWGLGTDLNLLGLVVMIVMMLTNPILQDMNPGLINLTPKIRETILTGGFLAFVLGGLLLLVATITSNNTHHHA